MDEWMEGWINGGWMDGWMNLWWIDGWTDGQTDRWLDGQTDRYICRYSHSYISRYLIDPPARGSAIIGPEIKTLPSEWTIQRFSL